MKKLLVTFLLLSICLGKLLTSTNTNTKLTFPSNANSVLALKFNSHATYKNLIPGAKWIWDNSGINTPKGDKIVTKYQFWAECRTSMSLKVAAYGDWWVQWNGKEIAKGSGYQQATTVKLTPVICGENLLRVQAVKTRGRNDWAGLIYRLDQDQSSCKCSPNKWWNPNTCRCECLHKCSCPSEKYWSTYRCACRCKISTIERNSFQSRYRRCRPGRYWNPSTCRCECYPKKCQYGQNPLTC